MRKTLSDIFSLFTILLILTELGYSQNRSNPKVAERIAYINQYKDLAISQMKKYNIPASITLAQACLESGNGKSTLAQKGNNHFGIKCHYNWKGETIYHDDDVPNECFRKYQSPEDSFRDHSEYLTTQKRYASLFAIENGNYKKWAHGLKSAGYATNPNYAQALINIIEDYELYKYDSGEYSKDVNSQELPEEKLKDAAEDIELEWIDKRIKPLKHSQLYAINPNRQLYEEDGRPYIFATEGDTYESIAKEYNLFNREIRKMNKVSKKDRPRPGAKIYIGK